MIVQCSECSAKFKLDDSKVTEKGVRVRCSKCKAVFMVKKESPQEEDLDSLLSGLGGEEGTAKAALAPPPVPDESPAPGEFSFSGDAAVPSMQSGEEAPSFGSETAEPGFKDFDFGEDALSASPSVASEPPAGDDFFSSGTSEFTFDEAAPPQDEGGGAFPGAADEAPFDFSDSFQSSPAEAPFPGEPEQPSGPGLPFGENGFSFDESPVAEPATGGDVPPSEPDFFGEFSMDEPRPEEETKSSPEDDFAFEMPVGPASDEKSEEFDFGDGESSEKEEAPAAPGFEDFDFGFAEEAPPAAPASAPAAERSRTAGFPETSPPVAFSPMPDLSVEEPAPAPAASARRREGPGMRPILLGVLALLLVGGGGYYLTTLSSADLDKLGLRSLAKKFGGAEEVRLEIRNVQGSFVQNAQAGELFVIRGEVANGGNRSRTGIQIKASVFGKGGVEVGHRTAFCGNPLTDQQIASLPFPELEKAMNDQFGQSLSNLGVEPGKSVPFVVVLNGIPADAVQYGAEIAASAPAGK
jgi:predicted Zn finger-like uncharacterized protein